MTIFISIIVLYLLIGWVRLSLEIHGNPADQTFMVMNREYLKFILIWPIPLIFNTVGARMIDKAKYREQETVVKKIINPNEKLWKSARWGVIAFCVIHFFLETFVGTSKYPGIPIVFNYLISTWFIKKQISKGKNFYNPLFYGFLISGAVFLIRLILTAAILYFLAEKY